MSKKGNGYHDYKQAIEDKKTCGTCGGGETVGLVSPNSQPGTVAIVPLVICGCQQSMYYMRLGTQMASCRCWQKQSDKPKILIPTVRAPRIMA